MEFQTLGAKGSWDFHTHTHSHTQHTTPLTGKGANLYHFLVESAVLALLMVGEKTEDIVWTCHSFLSDPY